MAEPTETWDLWLPGPGATGLPFARSRVNPRDARDRVLVHAAPQKLNVTVRDDARGEGFVSGVPCAHIGQSVGTYIAFGSSTSHSRARPRSAASAPARGPMTISAPSATGIAPHDSISDSEAWTADPALMASSTTATRLPLGAPRSAGARR